MSYKPDSFAFYNARGSKDELVTTVRSAAGSAAGSHVLTERDRIVKAYNTATDDSNAAVTVYLPDPSIMAGPPFAIHKMDATANGNVTVNGDVVGTTSWASLTALNDYVLIWSNGYTYYKLVATET